MYVGDPRLHLGVTRVGVVLGLGVDVVLDPGGVDVVLEPGVDEVLALGETAFANKLREDQATQRAKTQLWPLS